VTKSTLLSSVATAVSDGQAVDWAAADSQARDPETRQLLEHLKVIASIAGVHRDTPPEGEDPALPGQAPGDELPGRWTHLEVRERLGDGAWGVVYRAWDPRLEREVALKLIPEHGSRNDSQTVIEEARLMARVDHPGVVTIYGAARADGYVGLWMERIDGETLEAMLRSRGPFSAREAALVGLDVVEALAAVHGAGLLHRDIKAQNVMRDRNGRIVLMDFSTGRERRLSDEIEVSDLAGTPLYMAPELFAGGSASVQSDIYSVGVLLFRLVTLKTPISAKSLQEVRAAHASGHVRRLRDERSDLPAGFVQIVERALAKEPADRFESAGELEAALTGFLAAKPRPSPVPGWRDAPRWMLVAVGVLAAALAGSLAFIAVRGLRSPVADPRPMPLVMYPPPGGEFDAVAISPDGTRLAFESRGRLWVRPLHVLQATEVLGTSGGRDPFWSPDGRDLAFFKAEQLWSVPASAGSQPRVLGDAPRHSGGSWGADNTIVFAINEGTAIHRMPARGGQPEPIRMQGVNDLYELRWPSMLPSGRGFVYSALDRRSGRRVIMLARFGEARDTPLVESASNAIVAGGRLLFVQRGRLHAQPFDANRGRLTGTPVVVADRLDPSPYHSWRTDISANESGQLAFVGGRQPDRQLQLVDRSGEVLRSYGEPGEFRDIAVSHDGRFVAYEERDPTTGSTDIWTLDLERGLRTQVAMQAAEETCPTWSPDGRALYYALHESGRSRLMRRAMDGASPATVVLDLPALAQPYDVSVGDEWLAYQQLDPGTRWNAMLLSFKQPASPTAIRRSMQNDDEPAFSPDGRFVAYSSREAGDRFVFLERVPPSGHPVRVSIEYGRQPLWRADGHELYFHGQNRKLMAVAVDLSETPPRIGVPRELFELKFRGWDLRRHYGVLPNGQRFMLNAPVEGVFPVPVTVLLNWNAR
jgi:eukaryotic-like serine/threonine-protein kinase